MPARVSLLLRHYSNGELVERGPSMPARHARLLHHIHRLLTPWAGDGQADADLLARYVDHRVEAAFAALMHRHGPMVLNICRRLIGDGHAAEDAFQATFLVL